MDFLVKPSTFSDAEMADIFEEEEEEEEGETGEEFKRADFCSNERVSFPFCRSVATLKYAAELLYPECCVSPCDKI